MKDQVAIDKEELINLCRQSIQLMSKTAFDLSGYIVLGYCDECLGAVINQLVSKADEIDKFLEGLD